MIIGILTFFAGINMAFAMLGLLVYLKNSAQRFYLYFSIFSLFSSIYLTFNGLTPLFLTDIGLLELISAGIYYAIFPWFVFSFIGNQTKIIPSILSATYLVAILVYVLIPDQRSYPLWQLIAHLGLLGLVAITWYASVKLLKSSSSIAREFIVLTIVFSILAIEEVITTVSGQPFFTLFTDGILLLDIYPILFTVVIGVRLSNDVQTNYKIRLEAVQNGLNQEKLKLEESERKRLQSELRNKNKDLTDFGIEITRKKEFTKQLYEKLTKFKKQSKIDSPEFREILFFTKSNDQIDKEIDYLQRNVESVNHEFISILKKECPSLTASELHMASLLRLKLNTKEIATIKNITPDSVKVMRYRIRKKLSLHREEHLIDYMLNLA